jgi:glutamate/tyrosine decarboxylase-like PLP-dependent enzyme
MSDRLFSGASPEKVAADLAPLVDFQEDGLHIADLIWMVEDVLIPHLVRYELPSCQGLFNSPLEEGAAYGGEVALEWNQGVTNWQVSPGGATLEELCCQALCKLFGMGPAADATMLYSGTYANQQAIYMALHHWAAMPPGWPWSCRRMHTSP